MISFKLVSIGDSIPETLDTATRILTVSDDVTVAVVVWFACINM